MKQLLFSTILIIGLANRVISQSLSNQAKEFITNIYKERRDTTKQFLYVKSINSYEKKAIIQAVEKSQTLKYWGRVDNKQKVADSLILSAKEKHFILSELEKQIDTSLWSGINIPNSRAISRDTIAAILGDGHRYWNYFYTMYGSSFNSFIIPIFFRNNQLCAFYYDNRCGGLCGEGVFAIYKREKDRWIRCFIMYEWIS